MEEVVLVIHLILALAIIGLVLLQRSEGGGLGIGGGGGGLGNFASAQGTANILTKATALCAAAFFATSLTLGILAGQGSAERQGILANMDSAAKMEEAMEPPPFPQGQTDDKIEDEMENEVPSAPIAE